MKIITVAEATPDVPRKSEGDVVELADGRLFLSYMEFSGDGSDFANTRLVAVESADGGVTWSGRRVLTETSPGDMNVYSPNLVRRDDGSILFIFMRQHRGDPNPTTLHVWISKDECRTFAPLATLAERGSLSLCNAVVRRLSTGRLILPFGSPAVLYSDDGGSTWKESASRLHLPMRGLMEPHVEQTRDGRVLMVIRNQLGSLFMSESGDDGETWSKPQTTGLRTPESCPNLVRIPSTGDLLMVWNNAPYDPEFASHFGKRSPLSAAVSRDEGRTWQTPKDIESDPSRAFSNPGCRFTRHGSAIVNYWTCKYLPNWYMPMVIELRVAIIELAWFYGRSGN